MSVSVERLRIWLLAGVVLLMLVIVAFLGYGRYRARHFLSKLPAKLGINITQETSAFTYSQTDGPRTIFTLHAAKSIQHTDGKYLLQDVGIVLYGKKQDRADRIWGKEFEYDQNAGVIRAIGKVHIDMAAPMPMDAGAKRDFAAGGDPAHGGKPKDPQIIHVTTSGLVYMQKLAVAATDQELEFEFHGMTGHAKGADYNTDSGELLLHAAVQMSGLERGQPVILTAHAADLNRQSELVVLQHARYAVIEAGGTRTLEAEKATVHLRSDGTAERVEAEGNVSLMSEDGATVTAPSGEMTLNAQNQPQSAIMTGGVRLVEDGPERQTRGEAAVGRVAFDKVGQPEHAVMTGAVHLHERQRVTNTAAAWSERDLAADAVELALAGGAGRTTELRDAKATGSARMTVVGGASQHPGATHVPSSALAGDVLTAHFTQRGGATEIETLHGDGHTMVRRVNDLGVEDTSTGDVLDASFNASDRQPVKKNVGRKMTGHSPQTAQTRTVQTVATALQVGHVVLIHKTVAKPGEPAAEQRATGQRGSYDGSTERLTLTGAVQVTQPEGVLWADRMVMEQASGDVAMEGGVKASYQQAGAAEPTHVLAARGELKHDAGIAFFYGVPGTLARLWQGGSQVEAPVLQLNQKQHSLLARGEDRGTANSVHTTLVNAAPSPNKTPNKAKDAGKPKEPAVVRIVSRELTYSDIARKAEFTGGVDVRSADGTMHGQQATVFLQMPADNGSKAGVGAPKAAPGQAGFMGGQVERIIATGRVALDQPGRKATGEQLVYTAADGMYVLTGLPEAPPMMQDEVHGSTTGCALQFHTGDNSVVVSNEGCSGENQKVRTETQVKDRKP